MNWILIAVAGIISGGFSALGLGAGTVLLLYLTLFTDTPQLTAQGINLLFFIPTAVVALFFHFKKKLVKLSVALFCAGGGVLGALLGVWLSSIIEADFLRKIFGGFLLVIGLRELFTGIKEVKKKKSEKNISSDFSKN